MSSCHRVKLFENQSNHSYVGFIRLVTWPGVKRLPRKDMKAQNYLRFFSFLVFFLTQRSSAKCGVKQSRFSFIAFPSLHFLFNIFCFSSLCDNISYCEFTSSFENFFIEFYELFDVYLELSFILVMILAWVILRRTIYILPAQEGYKGFEFFSDKETWPHHFKSLLLYFQKG